MHELLELLIELMTSALDLQAVWRFCLCLAGSILAAGLINAWTQARNLPVWPIMLLIGCALGVAWEVASRR